jgi:phytoene synthase
VEESLAAAYRRCRDLHRRHGRSYYLATRLLPAWKRPHVHALYGFTRYTDEIVDRTEGWSVAERQHRLRDWSARFLAGLAGQPVADPLLPAVLHTIAVFGLDHADFVAFLRSMEMDLTVGEFADYPALLSYMEGSAAAVGTMMLPILESADLAAAREPARQLGLAFQLTNFIRDVGEDLARGRVYLPQDDLARHCVSRADLAAAAARGAATPPIKELVKVLVGRARDHYAAAAPGIPLLAPASRACVRAAYHLYGEILHEVERADWDVFCRRAVVPACRRLRIAARSVLTHSGVGINATI